MSERRRPDRQPCTAEGCTGTWAPDPRRKTTLCRRCAATLFARDPARNAKLAASMRDKHADPAWQAHRAPGCAQAGRTLKANEEFQVRNREHMRRVGKANGGSVAGSDERRRAARSLSEAQVGHIPLEYRGEYRRLMVSQRMRRDERTRIIGDLVEADRRTFERTGRLPQFEREKGKN